MDDRERVIHHATNMNVRANRGKEVIRDSVIVLFRKDRCYILYAVVRVPRTHVVSQPPAIPRRIYCTPIYLVGYSTLVTIVPNKVDHQDQVETMAVNECPISDPHNPGRNNPVSKLLTREQSKSLQAHYYLDSSYPYLGPRNRKFGRCWVFSDIFGILGPNLTRNVLGLGTCIHSSGLLQYV